MINFSEYYKTVPAHQLLEVIEYPYDYQPEAIEAAKEELQQRQLSETQLSEARAAMLNKRDEQRHAEQKLLVHVNAVNTGKSLWASASARYSVPDPDLETARRFVCMLFALLLGYYAFMQYKYIVPMLKFIFSEPLTIFYVWPYIVLPISIVAFSMRKQWGWILMAIYVTYHGIEILTSVSMTYGTFFWAGYDVTDIWQHLPWVWYMVMINLYCGTFYFLYRKDIREYYRISQAGMIRTLLFSIIFFVFLVVVVFNF